MKILFIHWTEDSADHIARHGITPEEVEEACHRSPHIRRGRGPKKRKIYEVYGRSDAGRYLFVVVRFVEATGVVIITARDMDTGERRKYQGVQR